MDGGFERNQIGSLCRDSPAVRFYGFACGYRNSIDGADVQLMGKVRPEILAQCCHSVGADDRLAEPTMHIDSGGCPGGPAERGQPVSERDLALQPMVDKRELRGRPVG
jgi:hypothetical protein